MKCPYCDGECEADYVDIGVGMQQVTPFGCYDCGAVQVNPYHKDLVLDEDEKLTGFHKGQGHGERTDRQGHSPVGDVGTTDPGREHPDHSVSGG